MSVTGWRRASRLLAVLVVGGVLLGARPARAQTEAEVGRWSARWPWPVSSTHSILLPTGKVMFFGEFEEGNLGPYLWDPAARTTELPKADYNIFCSGHSFLPDGRLFLTGGHVTSHVGEPHARIFDSSVPGWSNAPDMNNNRWYPTNTTLASGEVLVLSGETVAAGTNNELPQVYQPDTNTWRNLTTAMKDLPYYPRTFLAPNGKVFCAGPRRASYFLDTEGTGTWYEHGFRNYGIRSYAPAVIMDGKVTIFGGGDPPTATVEQIDLTAAQPRWQYVAPMSVARRQHNAVLLPDGRVLVLGGSSASGFNNSGGAVLHTEVWDPAANTWTTWASASRYYGYHSTALLVPDGRVMLGGGRYSHDWEVFSPPYLFKGPRPTFASAPEVVTPGTPFFVGTPEAASISKVTLIALGAVTHSFDQNQRLLTLPFQAAADGLNIAAPANNNFAPPGPYMLFLVNSQGVPSVGRMVRVAKVGFKTFKPVVLSDTWKYDDSGVDRGTEWINLNYDDSAWKSGPGQLGFGDEDEGTVLTPPTTATPTYYFRKKFTLDQLVTGAHLEALFDDGIAVWINGVPVFSRNVGALGFSHYATDSEDNAYVRAPIPLSPNPFVIGENVVTALVKQVGNGSTDLTFALGLELDTAKGPYPDALTLLGPNGGETFLPGAGVELRWSAQGSITQVDLAYSVDGGQQWTSIATGVPNTGAYHWTVPEVETKQGLVRVSKSGGSLSDASDATFTITREERVQAISFGGVWKYEDSGLDPGSLWNTAGFDDSAWKSGPGKLGYGDGGEGTLLTRTTPSQTSVYFRKKITVSGAVTAATLSVLFDDGLVVFVNGTQVFARNVDSGTAHAKYASASVDEARETVELPASAFVSGENTIGVMVKQVGKSSPDLTFDLSLELGVTPPPPAAQ